MDPAEAKALASQVTTAVATAIGGVLAAGAAGAAAGPAAMAMIGQVQVLSQLGKVGGGGGALSAFSEGFEWANFELPVSLFPGGNMPEPNPADEEPTSTGVRRWLDEARRSFRRAKRPRPRPGEPACEYIRNSTDENVTETLFEQDKNVTETLVDEYDCDQCGVINGIPLLDKLVVICASLIAVFAIRSLAQLIVTRCCKKDPMDSLRFPVWEGPTLLVHWFSLFLFLGFLSPVQMGRFYVASVLMWTNNRFGMCDSLAATLGRPCSLWIGLSAALLFLGPICFMIYAFWRVSRHVKKGSVVAHSFKISTCAGVLRGSTLCTSSASSTRRARVVWRLKHRACKNYRWVSFLLTQVFCSASRIPLSWTFSLSLCTNNLVRLMEYSDIENVEWKKMRERMRQADTCKSKIKAFTDWIHSTRHHGEWKEETKVGNSASATMQGWGRMLQTLDRFNTSKKSNYTDCSGRFKISIIPAAISPTSAYHIGHF
jgi:hypothetical protein